MSRTEKKVRMLVQLKGGAVRKINLPKAWGFDRHIVLELPDVGDYRRDYTAAFNTWGAALKALITGDYDH